MVAKQKGKIYVIGVQSSRGERVVFGRETHEKMKGLLEFEKLGKEIKEQ